MPSLRTRSLVLMCALALLMPPPGALALLNIDGTRNQLFVFGSASLTYDSNIFASPNAEGDYIYNANVGTELKRRAGIISVNLRAELDYQRFNEFTDQSAWNPNFFLELDKASGRTTGAFTVRAYRSSRADSAINLRTQSWNYPLGLSLKYPVNDKFYLTSQTNYLRRDFKDTEQLLNYTDYSESLDVFYVFTSKLDLFGGYRFRVGRTDLDTTFDHNFSVGATGALFAKLNGTLRAGYQLRELDRAGEQFGQFNTSAALTWNATRKLTFNGVIARDFTTTATGVSVDTLSTMLRSSYVFTRRFSLEGGAGYGRNRFLDGTQLGRSDEFFTADLGVNFTLNEHFKMRTSANYLRNWSTFAGSDFERFGYSIDISSRF